MAKTKTPKGKAPECPQTRRTPAVDVKPSRQAEAQEGAVEARETASAPDAPAPSLKQGRSTGFRPISDTETARERGRAGGLASAASRRRRRQMREYLEEALRMPDKDSGECNAMSAALAMVEEAKAGNVRAFQAILEALGEKAPQMLDVRSGDGSMSPGRQDLTALPFDQLMALTAAEWRQDDEALAGWGAEQ